MFLVAWTEQSWAPRTLGDMYIPNVHPVQAPRTRKLAGGHNKCQSEIHNSEEIDGKLGWICHKDPVCN